MNRLRYKLVYGATRGRDLCLLIDDRPFLDILEAAIPAEAPERTWPEKADAVVLTKELKRSVQRPGQFHFFTCSHCRMPEDLTLEPILVQHQGDEIVWHVKPPGADVRYSTYPILELRFCKQQYEEAIQALLQRDPTHNDRA